MPSHSRAHTEVNSEEHRKKRASEEDKRDVEVDICSSDSDCSEDEDEDYYLDEETGKPLTADQIIGKEREEYEEFRNMLYGANPLFPSTMARSRSRERMKATSTSKSREAKKRHTEDEEESDDECAVRNTAPKKKQRRA